MSTTVLEALQNAQINFETAKSMGAGNNPIFGIAMDQLGQRRIRARLMKFILILMLLQGDSYQVEFSTMEECKQIGMMAVLIVGPEEVTKAECEVRYE